jgi:exopolysaccharide production protein ExoQ
LGYKNKKSPSKIEYVLNIYILFLTSAALLPLLFTGDFTHSEVVNNPLISICWLIGYAITLSLFVLNYKKVLALLINELFLLLICIYVFFSTIWSFEQELTLRSSLILFWALIYSAYLASKFTFPQIIKLLSISFSLMIGLSFLFGIILPEYGVMRNDHEGAWRGIFIHKNSLGRMMVLSAVIFMLFQNKTVKYTGFFASILLLILSTSKTALIICIAILLLIPFYRWLRGNNYIVIPIYICTAFILTAIVFLILNNLETIFTGLGKDMTLTGRTDLWAAALGKITEHLFLGYGYSAFWLGWYGESAYVWRSIGWEAPHSHNGFLDVWLEIGIIGLLLFLIGFVKGFWKSIILYKQHTKNEYLFPLLYFSFVLFYNLTEGFVLKQNSFFWIIYMVILLRLSYVTNEGEKNT